MTSLPDRLWQDKTGQDRTRPAELCDLHQSLPEQYSSLQ